MTPRSCEFINDWRPRPSWALLNQTKAQLVEYVGVLQAVLAKRGPAP
jgi:hypothetical protein